MSTNNEKKNGTIIEVVDYRAKAMECLAKIEVLNSRAKTVNEKLEEHLVPRISSNMSITSVKTEIGYTVVNATDNGLEIKIDGDTLITWNGKDFTFTYRGKTIGHYDKKADKELLESITMAHKKFFGEVNENTYLDLCKAYNNLLEDRYKDYTRSDSFASAAMYNGYAKTEEALKDKALTYEDVIKVWLEESE